MTDVPKIAKEIDTQRAGCIMKYNSRGFINALSKIISSKKLYSNYRKTAIKMSQRYDINTILKRAFKLS